ncbi:MAG: hypothetical protein ABRQ38_22815 [Candidatus Eremiobacterota bacterium]
MTCPECKVKMVEQKRPFHKKRKWICPVCKKVRMETVKKTRKNLYNKKWIHVIL